MLSYSATPCKNDETCYTKFYPSGATAAEKKTTCCMFWEMEAENYNDPATKTYIDLYYSLGYPSKEDETKYVCIKEYPTWLKTQNAEPASALSDIHLYTP